MVAAPPADARPAARTQDRPARPGVLRRRYQSAAHLGPVSTWPQYRAVRDAGLALLRKFPPTEHYIVGVGRSPTMVIGFLKALSLDGEPDSFDVPAIATTIPASGLKREVAPAAYAEYYRHFERFLPADVRRGERTVVLVDSLYTGSSVRRLATILEAYWRSRRVHGKVILSGFDVLAERPGRLRRDRPGAVPGRARLRR